MSHSRVWRDHTYLQYLLVADWFSNNKMLDTPPEDKITQFQSIINTFLAHQIRISEILPWDRKSYLTHAILPRLSCEGYIHWLYWNSHTLSPTDVIVMLK